MQRSIAIVALTLTFSAVLSSAARAQPSRVLVEGYAGAAWFIDEDPIDHAVLAASARYFVTSRLALGPEVTYMRGPGIDRDWFLMGNVSWDLAGAGRTVTPYVIGSAGLQRTRLAVGTGAFVSKEGAWTGGVGVRVAPQRSRWFIAPEFRIGWEPHWRLGAWIGIR